MDAIDSTHSSHSSPNSIRPTDWSQDYDYNPDCRSVYDDDRHDLSETYSCPAADDCHHRNNNNNKSEDTSDAMNNSNQFNNRRNNIVSCVSDVSAANLIDQKISAIIMKNKCNNESHSYDKKYINDFRLNNSDVESQKCELKRNKSLIKRLYSGSGRCKRVPVATRLSILGKPIPCHRLKNDIDFYKERVAVYNFLSRPRGWVAIGYHVFVSLVVSFCLPSHHIFNHCRSDSVFHVVIK